MKLSSFSVGNKLNIKLIEDNFDIKLPSDYKDFLIKNNGAYVQDGHFFVNEISEFIPMGYFFGVNSDKGYSDIIKINKEYFDDILKDSILIGNDVGSGFILLIFDGENNGIWYYDHTYFFSNSSDELNTYFICDTFTDFLNILNKKN